MMNWEEKFIYSITFIIFLSVILAMIKEYVL